jgi:hypothetical protein
MNGDRTASAQANASPINCTHINTPNRWLRFLASVTPLTAAHCLYTTHYVCAQEKLDVLSRMFNLAPLHARALAASTPRLLSFSPQRLAASRELLTQVHAYRNTHTHIHTCAHKHTRMVMPPAGSCILEWLTLHTPCLVSGVSPD